MEQVEIRIGGHLDLDWQGWFQGFEVRHTKEGLTVLTGPVRDQSDLYGLIAKLRDLGVTLLGVNLLRVE